MKLLFEIILCISLVSFSQFGLAAEDQNDFPFEPKINYLLSPLLPQQGYILGRLVQSANEGIFIRTFEGEIRMSVNSSPSSAINPSCMHDLTGFWNLEEAPEDQRPFMEESVNENCMEQVNPWPISAYGEELNQKINDSLGKLAVFQYYESRFLPFLESDFVLKDILPVDPNYDIPSSFQAVVPPPRGVSVEIGSYIGRIAQVSFMGLAVFNEYEAIIQRDTSGSQFFRMGVINEDMFNHIFQYMLTGHLLQIHYFRLTEPTATLTHRVLGNNDSYRIYAVDIIAEDFLSNSDISESQN